MVCNSAAGWVLREAAAAEMELGVQKAYGRVILVKERGRLQPAVQTWQSLSQPRRERESGSLDGEVLGQREMLDPYTAVWLRH